MTQEQKDFFNKVIKPKLISMTIDCSLPSDMTELQDYHFEEEAEAYNNPNELVVNWAEMASQLLLTNKGLTHSHKRCRFMEEGESFFVIGTNGHEKVYSELPSSKDILKFYEDNKELLMSGDLCLGGWLDEVNDKYVLDVSMLVPTSIGLDEAVLIGKKHGQVAIFDMRDSSVIFVDAHLAKNSVSSEL
jgi:hypothetical protein